MIDGSAPYTAEIGVVAADPAQATAAARYAARGYAQIKIYNSVSPALVPAITAVAHARGHGAQFPDNPIITLTSGSCVESPTSQEGWLLRGEGF